MYPSPLSGLKFVIRRFDRNLFNVTDQELYPFPQADVLSVLGRYSNADVVWFQEEPENMGPLVHVQACLPIKVALRFRMISRMLRFLLAATRLSLVGRGCCYWNRLLTRVGGQRAI